MAPGETAMDAANTIKTACATIANEYAHLAESGKGILGDITTGIGLFFQYKWTVTYSNGGFSPCDIVEYHDAEPKWWERGLIGIGGGYVTTEKVPHPRREEARQKLSETQGTIEDADRKFDLDSKSVKDTVTSVGNFMGDWLNALKALSAIPFPEDPRDVPTSGDPQGWRSPYALDVYERNMDLQFAAHETTESTILNMLDQSAEFLKTLKDHLAAFAQLVRDQEQYYVDLATSDWIPEKGKTLGWVIDSIGRIGTAVVEYKKQQDDKASAMIDVLNEAISSVLKIESLLVQLDGMSRAGSPGWPMPNALSGQKSPGSSGETELVYNTTYFKDHINAWESISTDLGGVTKTAESVDKIEHMFLRWPEFASTTASSINNLSTTISTDALSRGGQAASKISENLDATIRAYLETEEINAELAKKLEDILG